MAHTVDLSVTGMNCAACVARVERALRQIPGVETAEVNLARGTARVKTDKVSPEPLIAASSKPATAAASISAPPNRILFP